MGNALELLEQGRVGMTTAMGMGGVFLALLCLYGFTTVLGRIFSPKTAKTRGKPETKGTQAPQSSTETPEESEQEALAAALAVAIAIQADGQRALPLSLAGASAFTPSPWKVAGRRALMHLPSRSAARKPQ